MFASLLLFSLLPQSSATVSRNEYFISQTCCKHFHLQTTADTNLRGVSPDSEEVAEKNATLNKKKKVPKGDDEKEEEKPLDRPTDEGKVSKLEEHLLPFCRNYI